MFRAGRATTKKATRSRPGGGAQGIAERRARDNAAHAKRRASDALVLVPDCEDKERRARLEADDEAWLLHYFGVGCELDDPFWYAFTPQQKEMIRAIRHAIVHGGDQAIAASRGEGKSTIAERLVLKSALEGTVNYAVLFASTGPMADNSLDSIKTAITENPLLAADYPEVCVPVIALEGAPQRANTQRVSGNRHDNGQPYEMAETRFTWCGQEIIFPRVPGSPSAGFIIATRGLDAAVRGLKKRGKRPKLAVIDDPDTEETAASEEQAKKLGKRIDAAIGFLGGQQRAIGRVILTTIQSRTAISWSLTDPIARPTFRGKRFRFLLTRPEREDLWAEYVAMRKDDLRRKGDDGELLDPFCRRSFQFYATNQAEMDRGAAVANPNRFDPSPCPDGTPRELSALQRYFNEVARVSQEYVSTEYDNNPPAETAIVESALMPLKIQRQVSGFARGVVPPGCVLLTAGIDCGKWGLHWVVIAWTPSGGGYVIDYGVHEIYGVRKGSDEGVDVALHNAVLDRLEAFREAQYLDQAGSRKDVSLSLVDAGYRTDAIYAACYRHGAGTMPVMGFGKSLGCTQADFSAQYRATQDKRPGDGWFQSRKGKIWLVCADTDRWKNWLHDRWMSDPMRPGSMQMWGDPADSPDRLSADQSAHHTFAHHICAESEVEEPHRGVVRRRWKSKSHNNHWLDASYYAAVAMSIRGVSPEISAPSVATRRTDPATRPSISSMRGGSR